MKAASDIYSPVSGEVVETNSELESQPNLINSSPEADGTMALRALMFLTITINECRLANEDQTV